LSSLLHDSSLKRPNISGMLSSLPHNSSLQRPNISGKLLGSNLKRPNGSVDSSDLAISVRTVTALHRGGSRHINIVNHFVARDDDITIIRTWLYLQNKIVFFIL
jgi:hypothetical protein